MRMQTTSSSSNASTQPASAAQPAASVAPPAAVQAASKTSNGQASAVAAAPAASASAPANTPSAHSAAPAPAPAASSTPAAVATPATTAAPPAATAAATAATTAAPATAAPAPTAPASAPAVAAAAASSSTPAAAAPPSTQTPFASLEAALAAVPSLAINTAATSIAAAGKIFNEELSSGRPRQAFFRDTVTPAAATALLGSFAERKAYTPSYPTAAAAQPADSAAAPDVMPKHPNTFTYTRFGPIDLSHRVFSFGQTRGPVTLHAFSVPFNDALATPFWGDNPLSTHGIGQFQAVAEYKGEIRDAGAQDTVPAAVREPPPSDYQKTGRDLASVCRQMDSLAAALVFFYGANMPSTVVVAKRENSLEVMAAFALKHHDSVETRKMLELLVAIKRARTRPDRMDVLLSLAAETHSEAVLAAIALELVAIVKAGDEYVKTMVSKSPLRARLDAYLNHYSFDKVLPLALRLLHVELGEALDWYGPHAFRDACLSGVGTTDASSLLKNLNRLRTTLLSTTGYVFRLLFYFTDFLLDLLSPTQCDSVVLATLDVLYVLAAIPFAHTSHDDVLFPLLRQSARALASPDLSEAQRDIHITRANYLFNIYRFVRPMDELTRGILLDVNRVLRRIAPGHPDITKCREHEIDLRTSGHLIAPKLGDPGLSDDLDDEGDWGEEEEEGGYFDDDEEVFSRISEVYLGDRPLSVRIAARQLLQALETLAATDAPVSAIAGAFQKLHSVLTKEVATDPKYSTILRDSVVAQLSPARGCARIVELMLSLKDKPESLAHVCFVLRLLVENNASCVAALIEANGPEALATVMQAHPTSSKIKRDGLFVLTKIVNSPEAGKMNGRCRELVTKAIDDAAK